MATLRDIAARLGVSAMTVSLALRNDPRVSPQTREKVLQAAREMGYRSNPFLSAWMRNRKLQRPRVQHPTIALIALSPMVGAYPEHICRGGKRMARALGYQLEVFNAQEFRLDWELLFQTLRNRGIRGVLFTPFYGRPVPEVKLIEPFCVASIVQSAISPEMDYVSTDDYAKMTLAIEHADVMGRRIGHYPIDYGIPCHERYLTVYSAYRANQPPERRCEYVGNRKFAPVHFLAWVRRAKPDVLIAQPEVIYALAASEMKNSVTCVLMDRFSTDRQFAGIDNLHEHVSAAAVRLVAQKMELNETGLSKPSQSTLIRPEWRDKEPETVQA